MKRLWTLVLSVILAAALGGSALAAASAEVTRAFVQGDTLYTYVNLTGNTAPITKAEAAVGTRIFAASGTLETVRQAGFPVTYLLLLDASTSMPGYREEVAAYTQALSQTAGENTRFLLATFGAAFTPAGDEIAADALGDAVAAVSYTETSSRLLEGISAALDYLEGLPRTGNELRNIVVLSDAVEYDADGSVSYDELLTRLTASDAMLHSVGFGGDATAQGSLAALAEASGGRHWAVDGNPSAESAAAALAENNGGLYVTSFDLGGYGGSGTAEPVSVTFSSGAELVCRAQTAVTFPTGDTPAGEESPVQEEPDRVLPPSGQTVQAPSSPAAAEEASGLKMDAATLEILAGVGLILVLAVILLVVLLRRRRRRQHPSATPASQSQAPADDPPASAGIYVRLEVLQGTFLGQSQEFTLTSELVIGREHTCDIVFDDPSISRRHARVFLAGGVVYLEDLGSQNGTQLNGARVEMPSVLRSGDAISLGDTALRLKF